MNKKDDKNTSAEGSVDQFHEWSSIYAITQDEEYKYLDCDKLWDEWLGCEYPNIDLKSHSCGVAMIALCCME
ncbi:MAG: hypothetical protein LBK70_02605 [Clostridiales bacterium]|jgi:hypothetical protein|nr:hypothetical protein [Clostridiales bacterium]